MSDKKLSADQRHLLKLVRSGADADGWAKVSAVVWPLMALLPPELVECHQDDSGWKARLTDAGKIVVQWL